MAKNWFKLELSTSNRLRDREGNVKTVFLAFGPPVHAFSKILEKLDLHMTLAYKIPQTGIRYDLWFVSYRRCKIMVTEVNYGPLPRLHAQ